MVILCCPYIDNWIIQNYFLSARLPLYSSNTCIIKNLFIADFAKKRYCYSGKLNLEIVDKMTFLVEKIGNIIVDC